MFKRLVEKFQKSSSGGSLKTGQGNRFRADGPIIVYQMGKVGSRSVYETLAGMGLGVPVYHRHVLEDLDRLSEGVKKQPGNYRGKLREIRRGKRLRRLIDREPEKRWNIITLVRDPVARSISFFFQNVFLGGGRLFLRKKIQKDAHQVENLLRSFSERWRNFSGHTWFDRQFKPVFGIDVYSRPFPWDRGFDIVRKGRFSALILRLEDLEACAGDAFSEFMGLTEIDLKRSNRAEDQWYRGTYKDFLSKLVLEDKFFDEIYGSKFARHFYSPAELQAFRAGWKNRTKG